MKTMYDIRFVTSSTSDLKFAWKKMDMILTEIEKKLSNMKTWSSDWTAEKERMWMSDLLDHYVRLYGRSFFGFRTVVATITDEGQIVVNVVNPRDLMKGGR